MKTANLFILLILTILHANNLTHIRDGEVYTEEELNKAIKHDVKIAITRSDQLSLVLKAFEFNVESKNNHLIDIDIEGLSKKKDILKQYSYAFGRLRSIKKEKLELLGNPNTPIFTNIKTDSLYWLRVKIRFTQIEDDDVKAFKNLFVKYTDRVFKGISIGQVARDILSKDQNKNDYEFISIFAIPQNFREYAEHEKNGIPLIYNGIDQIVVAKGIQDAVNKSLWGGLKKAFNGGIKCITGEEVINNIETDSINGYCRLLFTKNFNNSIPSRYSKKIQDFIDKVRLGQTKAAEISYLDCKQSLKDFEEEFPNDKRSLKNMKMVVTLGLVLHEKNILCDSNYLANKSKVINRFKNWMSVSNSSAPLYNYSQIFINGIYGQSFINQNNSHDARIFIPYSLDDPLIVGTIEIQKEIHKYIADYFKNLPNKDIELKPFTVINPNKRG